MKPKDKKTPLENYQGKRREQYEFSITVAIAAVAGLVIYIVICKIAEMIMRFF